MRSASLAGERRLWFQLTKGGSSDTLANELAVKPLFRPSGRTVATTVTPVTNLPKARRRSRRSISFVSMLMPIR